MPLLFSSFFYSLLFLPFCTISSTDHFSLCSVPVAALPAFSSLVMRLAFAYCQSIVPTSIFLMTVYFQIIFSEVLFLTGLIKKKK